MTFFLVVIYKLFQNLVPYSTIIQVSQNLNNIFPWSIPYPTNKYRQIRNKLKGEIQK